MTDAPGSAFTIGVEEELQLIDERGELAGRAAEVVADARFSDDVAGIERELQQSQLEAVSPVCKTLTELRTNLTALRREAASAAAAHDCRVASAGTHPWAEWVDQAVSEKEPYDRIAQDYAQLAEEQVVFGCHVHVGVEDRELRVQAMNHLRPWLPVLLALSASSPFWEGRSTGYASYRYLVFNRWPTFGTPPVFASWAELQSHIDLLTDVGAIDEPGRLYWTVRPSARFATLEVRMCDAATTVDEAVLIAGLIRALVMSAVRDATEGHPVPSFGDEVLRVAEWRAARFGLDGTLVDLRRSQSAAPGRVVGDLMSFVDDALDSTGDRAEVQELLRRHLAHGTSAHRQRATYARTGSLGAVVESLVDETHEGGHPLGEQQEQP